MLSGDEAYKQGALQINMAILQTRNVHDRIHIVCGVAEQHGAALAAVCESLTDGWHVVGGIGARGKNCAGPPSGREDDVKHQGKG